MASLGIQEVVQKDPRHAEYFKDLYGTLLNKIC